MTDMEYLTSLSTEIKWVDTSVDFPEGGRELTDEEMEAWLNGDL